MTKEKRKPLGKSQRFETSSAKWIDGIGKQLDSSNSKINVKCIPISQIIFDPQNSRQLLVTREEIAKGPKLNLDDFDDQGQNKITMELEKYFSNDENGKQKIDEYLDLMHLASSIQAYDKLINPVTVYTKGVDFHLISGHRRTLAHLILGADKIFAKILPSAPDALEHSLIQWKENKDRQDLTLYDEICNIQKIILSWEKESKKTISIRKLMALLSIKKTKASYYLAIIRELEHNKKLLQAVKQQYITSLELSYNISTMTCSKSKDALLTEILSGNKFNYQQLMSRIKNPDLSVRSPNTAKVNKENILNITKQSNLEVISKITQILIKSPEFKPFQNEFDQINTKTKAGLVVAWHKIYEALDI